MALLLALTAARGALPTLVEALPPHDRTRDFYARSFGSREPAFLAAAVRAFGAADALIGEAIEPFTRGYALVDRGSITTVDPDLRNTLPPERFDPAGFVSRMMRAPHGTPDEHSIVARFEGIDASIVPPYASALLGMRDEINPTRNRTLHVYASGPRGSALPKHTDPHDALVLGLYGEKTWTVCVPGGDAEIADWRLKANLRFRCGGWDDEADRASLGCAEYVVRGLAARPAHVAAPTPCVHRPCPWAHTRAHTARARTHAHLPRMAGARRRPALHPSVAPALGSGVGRGRGAPDARFGDRRLLS